MTRTSKKIFFSAFCFLTFIPFLGGISIIDYAIFVSVSFISYVGAVALTLHTFNRIKKINGYLAVVALAVSFMLYFFAAMTSEESLDLPKLVLPIILIQWSLIIWCLGYLLEKILKLKTKKSLY